jgi:O-succinylbenzoic acid--CoA ligase
VDGTSTVDGLATRREQLFARGGWRTMARMIRSFSLRAAAEESPDEVAVITPAETLSFGELWRRTEPIARMLAAGGDGSPVAIVAALRLETLLLIYALAEIGRPIVLLHPRLTERERAPLVADAGASTVFDATWTPSVGMAEGAGRPPPSPGDEDPLAILFTSGSSGSPKGVELSRRAFAAAAAASAENLGWVPADRWLLCMPIAHVGGLSVVLRCLAARATVVLSPWTGSIPEVLADVARHRVTLLSVVPTMLARVLEEGPPRPFPDHVRAVLLGGDAASAPLLEAAAARSVPVVTTYGMTEACSQVATLSPSERASAESGVGRPLPGTEVRIVDGEIQVRSRTLLTRYLPVAKWPSPFLEGGWFPTRDLGHLDAEGRLHVTGRKSDLIITGGENVDPREVEGVLLRCAGVRAACVFGVRDERWGEIVGAALVTDEASPPALDALAAYVKRELAAHKRPRLVAFCKDLVLNGTGKLDRKATAAKVGPALVRLT